MSEVDVHGEPIQRREPTGAEVKAYFQANKDRFKPVPQPKEPPRPEPKIAEVKAYITDETRRRWADNGYGKTTGRNPLKSQKPTEEGES